MRSQYTVEISQTDNGFFVKIGCMSLVYTEPAKFLSALEAWMNDPQRIEKEFINRYAHERTQAVEETSGYEGGGMERSAIPRDIAGAVRSTDPFPPDSPLRRR